MGRRSVVWLVTLPVVLGGVEAAHAVANAAFGSPEGSGEVLASRDSGAQLRPLLIALSLGVVVLALAGRALGRWWVSRHSRLVALPFACLPPLVFVLLELTEGALHTGALPWNEVLQPTFLAGLALQLPFALVGYLIARVLLRLTDELGRIARRRPPALAALPALLLRQQDDLPYPPRHGSPRWGRAPPVV